MNSMKPCAAFVGIFMLSCGQLLSQDLPHPKYNLRYHFVHNEHAIGGKVLPQKHPLSKAIASKYFSVGTDTNLITVVVRDQLGYDSIRSVPSTFNLSPFYIQKNEVTNSEYLEFVADSNSSFFKKNGLTGKWVLPDTSVWKKSDGSSSPLSEYYLNHKAYSNHPVVGVSQYQATMYCNWVEYKLNEQYKGVIPKGYKLIVDLPTSAEFYGTVQECILKPIEQLSEYGSIDGNNLIPFLTNEHINYKWIRTDRLVVINRPKGEAIWQVTEPLKHPLSPVNNLLGNVGEWTSTWGLGHLYNNKDYIYTTSGSIKPNFGETFPEHVLAPYLRTESALKMHFVVKGGSWNEDFFYIDPSSVKMLRGDEKKNNVGFRTVIRLKRL